MTMQRAERLSDHPTSGTFAVNIPRLSDADLRMFETPCSWRFLSLVRPFRSEDWWRDAVMDADEAGRGLIEWDKKSKRWQLSARGREHLGLKEVVR